MGKEDIGLKSYLEDAERYADLWDGGVFERKRVEGLRFWRIMLKFQTV